MFDRRWMGRAAFLIVCAACSRDDGEGQPQAVGEGADPLVVEEPRVTPAELAAAAVRVRAHSDSVRRAARARAGLPPDDPPPRTSQSAAATPKSAFQGCMEQAQAAEGHTRAQIERACNNLPGSPASGASSPADP
ncbi:hypothetical protein [Longimicrobium sp.]|jgi:hypothetical protein|uniref:hypothetical protein n=1 Tax=Longimicrobium sp. TaxID=2029185 RepID=UPI002F930A82